MDRRRLATNMNKKILILIVVLLVAKAVYEIMFYDYTNCGNGMFYKYPKGTADGTATYYKYGVPEAECSFFTYSEKCIELSKACVRK
jgi:hypothetical protein